MAHSVDFHAPRPAPRPPSPPIAPGETLHSTWTAGDPGVFMYHCHAAPKLLYVADGMYALVAVMDPAAPPLPPADREFAFVQSESYLPTPGRGARAPTIADLDLAAATTPDVVAFYGYANQFVAQPIVVKAGERIRVHLLNAGPSHFSAFHVVGTLFDHVWVDGNQHNDLRGVSTWTVASGEGATFNFALGAPGSYSMVTQS